MKPEILAPVGGKEQLIAAARCGADAVYLGAGGFNARQNAENFGDGALSGAVSYCHERGVQVNVTVNTLVMDNELEGLDRTVGEIANAGADAVIIQDLAVMRRFRDRCPDIARHASTQMTVHNLDGAKKVADMGFSRVVLSRELSLYEIERITAHCGIETEVFIHGALCMSLSGACYLSAMLGGRSGNRGLCAQPCRLDFKCGGRDYALSLKDMSHIKYIKELSEAGVSSLKIEGRMKRPEYVAAAVTACKKALNGEEYDIETLKSIFSRSGFTDGYMTEKRDVNMFGIRRKEDVTASAGVLGELASLYRAERQSVPVDMYFGLRKESSVLTVTDGENTAVSEGAAPQAAINRPLCAESAEKNLGKTGGTPYFVREFTCDIEPGLMLPVSELNALRREALSELSALRAEATKSDISPANNEIIVPHKAEKQTLWARFQNIGQMTSRESFEKILLPAREILKAPDVIQKLGDKLIAELPAVLFDKDSEKYGEKLDKLKLLGVTDIYCDNIYGIELAKKHGFTVHGGFGLNITNTDALCEYEKLGLSDAVVSFELTMVQIAALGGNIPRGIVAYGRLPLMRFRSCPAKGKNSCGDCNGRPTLKDRKNVEFPLLCSERKYTTLLNSVPLHIADKTMPQTDFLLLFFTTENREEAENVTKEYIYSLPSKMPRTGGLYYRGVK